MTGQDAQRVPRDHERPLRTQPLRSLLSRLMVRDGDYGMEVVGGMPSGKASEFQLQVSERGTSSCRCALTPACGVAPMLAFLCRRGFLFSAGRSRRRGGLFFLLVAVSSLISEGVLQKPSCKERASRRAGQVHVMCC